ncbi:MAG: sulfatase-like hydrolase/transferase [bacterium]|nr:sulfatase-like hydrolase/transferase [bacterium]
MQRLLCGVTLVALMCGLLGLAACSGGGSGAAGGSPPVVLVTIDGLVPSELAPFGGEKLMPALAALAERGQAWGDAWTAVPMTRPAVATYLTGLAPDRHEVRDDLFTSLADDVPTIAEGLSGRGYATAAFPDSSFLGFSSGLLRGFDIVDDPPMVPVNPGRWIPQVTDPLSRAKNFGAWLENVPADQPYFAWIHLSGPLVEAFRDAQFAGQGADDWARKRDERKQAGTGEATASDDSAEKEADAPDLTLLVDEALGKLVETLEARGDLGRALVVVAGTQGDPSGTKEDLSKLTGIGYSLHERAVRVPVVVALPGGSPGRGTDEPVWGPDVAATIAEATAIRLDPRAEGIALQQSAQADRTLFAWSWATVDQAAWPPLRAARSGDAKLVESFGEANGESLSGGEPADAAAIERLAAALAGRANPAAHSVDLDAIRALLEQHGIAPDPASQTGGRDAGTPEARAKAAWHLWNARGLFYSGKLQPGLRALKFALEHDPDNKGALLGRGQMMALMRHPKAMVPLNNLVTRYAWDPEAVHWYAHGLWIKSWQDAEPLLTAILPYKQQEGDLLYDLACARSLAEDLDESERFLRAAIDSGFKPWQLIESDPDLRNLRESERLSAIVQEYRN